MEASTLQPAASLARPRVAIGAPLLRFRSDEQLVELFRAGSEEAFRAIHDRYNKRLFAYARQMLPGRQDAEDALQDVFVRAYSGLRASDRELALRAWLFRIAHNRCVDELRKPSPPPPEVLQLVRSTVHDPLAEVDVRESLRRLVEDIRRLPEQQRSALLMRELGGMSYAELSASLAISVGAVKSLLVRARIALAEAAEARDTACGVIREQLVEAHDRGVRPGATARKHMRDCVGCKSFRRELRGVSRQLAATAPTLGPLGFLAKLLGFSGGAGGGAAGGASGALFGGGAAASAGGLAVGANHVAALVVAAVATAGGAVEIQHTILQQPPHRVTVRATPAPSTGPSNATPLPPRTAQVVESRGIPGVTGAVAGTVAKATVGVTSATSDTTIRHPRHLPGATRLPKHKFPKGSAGTATQTTDPATPVTKSGSDITTTTTTSQPSTTCPPAGSTSATGNQSSASGSTPATGTPTGSGSAQPTPSAATSSTSTSCGPTTGSPASAPTTSSDSSTTSGSTTPSSAKTTSSGSGSAIAPSSNSGATAASSGPGTTAG